MTPPRHKPLDVVELRAGTDPWPQGTIATAIEIDDNAVLVEISDDRGHGLDFLALPHHLLAAHKAGTPRQIVLKPHGD